MMVIVATWMPFFRIDPVWVGQSADDATSLAGACKAPPH
jgi:hypothetical protein